MEAKLAQQPPTEGPIPVKHDVLSQVLGKEKNGRVRGMGAGITPSRVDAQLQTGCWKQAFEERLEANYERTKMLEEIVFRLVIISSYVYIYIYIYLYSISVSR